MWSYLAVGSIAAAVTLIEVLTRYPDARRQLAKEWAAWTYIGIHVVASTGALWLLNNYVPWSFDPGQSGTTQAVTKIIVAAFGSLAVIRSSVFQTRIGDRVIDVGPHAIVAALLETTDRSMDRRHAEHRSAMVTEIMSNVAFDKAQIALPTHCFNAMQTVSDEEQEAVSAQLSKIAHLGSMTDRAKSLSLGFLLLDIVGENLLRQAVNDLGASIQ